MNKKSGYIFLVLGIILLVLFCLYNYTNLFVNKSLIKPNNSNVSDKNIGYDYVKSSDINKKTRINFPIYSNLKIDENNSNELYKSYKDEKNNYLVAIVSKNSNDINNYVKKQYEYIKEPYEMRGKKVFDKQIECKYLCYIYKIYNEDNSIYVDELNIYMKVSNDEIFEYKYHLEGHELSNELVNMIINSIKVTYDATYTIGKIINNQLSVDLKISDKKFMNILLNSNLYEEIMDKYNSINTTTIKNKKNDSHLTLTIKHKDNNITLKNDIIQYYNIDEKKVSIKEVKVEEKVFNVFDLNDKKIYVYPIDNSSMLLIESKDKKIDINDFKNITIKDV